jgi:hypothetical protein
MIVDLACLVTVTRADGSHVFTVTGHGVNAAAHYDCNNVAVVYQNAFADFLKNFDEELNQLGL